MIECQPIIGAEFPGFINWVFCHAPLWVYLYAGLWGLIVLWWGCAVRSG